LPLLKVVVFGILVQVTFDADVISYEDILVIFMTTHDPTLNKQSADRGTQYRSVVYYHDNFQNCSAEQVSKEVSSYYENLVVTDISSIDVFFETEKDY
jgi:peptide-methionine (S)-S-oxide reductase